MIMKYKNTWDVYVIPESYEPLFDFFNRLVKDKKVRKYAISQIERLKEAAYSPRIVRGEGEISDQDKKVLERCARSKETLFDDLMIAGQCALDEEVLSPRLFMDLEALVYDAKEK